MDKPTSGMWAYVQGEFNNEANRMDCIGSILDEGSWFYICAIHGDVPNAEANKDLIVVAINACKKVSPGNPLAVANQIDAAFKALEMARGRIVSEIAHHPEAGHYRQTLQGELRHIDTILAATTKEG